MLIVQWAGYPTYAKRFHTRVRYTGMAITGVLDDYQQAYLVIVPQVQAYTPAVLLSAESQGLFDSRRGGCRRSSAVLARGGHQHPD